MTFAWFDVGDGRRVFRRIPEPVETRSDLPCPMLIRDELDQPLQSMADGKWYTSKSALRSTYLPSGNPHGKRFVEVGTEYDKPDYRPPDPKIDDQGITQALQKAMARVQSGDVPTNP